MSLRLMSAVVSTSLPPTESKQKSAERLLKQLLECTQECQKRFGGRTELATEFDTCVVGLCLTLEALLSHGLRSKPLENHPFALKQVSEIVASSLHIQTETPSFWPFVRKHLTKHEKERYDLLKHIWTDSGRGRAWIRASLNERSLERHFHILLSNSELLYSHYEDGALLRDEEKAAMLPNMAAGVGSILFAISIDKADLNCGAPPRVEAIKTRAEPIIEAPLGTARVAKKKTRKVARQFISFDEEDSVSMLSTSVPSTSSSISSDSNSDTHSNKSSNRAKLQEISEEKKPAEIPPKRRLSFEVSGAREKFQGEVPNTLTPVSESQIGELTPVSVEINKNFESPDNSEDILEVPTDISAVITAIESRGEEELKKKQEKLEILAKENEQLKEQVKKYLSAIQMLRRDDGNEDLNRALDELNIEQQPDYKGEAKLFEQKLVQVAEMHAELMDFNVALQQDLCQREILLDRLRNELETLRGPMPSDEIGGNSAGCVNVWIPSAFLTGTGSTSHHVYQIFLRAGNDEWNIYRRYAQFYTLHKDLKKLDPAVGAFDFPPKKSIGKKDSALVEDRRKRLQTYLRKILAHWPELTHCGSRFLLEQHLAFFKDSKEVEERSKSVFYTRRDRNNSENNHYTGL